MPNNQQNDGQKEVVTGIGEPRQIVGFAPLSLLVHPDLVVPGRLVSPLGRAGPERQKEGIGRVAKNVKTAASRRKAKAAEGQKKPSANESPVGVVGDVGRGMVAADNEPKGNEENGSQDR